MAGFAIAVVGALKKVLLVVLPVKQAARGLGRALRWLIHLAILAAVLVGLHFLHQHLELGRILRGPDLLRQNWLPVLFLILYALAWLSWWLLHLLRADEVVQEFPDIAAAWDEAREALARAGIGLGEVPLYLVLGHCEGRDEALFEASLLKLAVKQAPPRPDAPVRVWASREAVYVTCPGASVLGRHAVLMTGAEEGGLPAAEMPQITSDTLARTNMPAAPADPRPEIEAILARARRERRLPTREETRQMRTLLRKSRSLQSLMQDPDELQRQSDRFAYLCQLLARDRAPYVPVNGVLLLLPLAGTDTDQDALDTGDACARDLAMVRRVLRVHSPILAVVCDLETAPGFREFLGLFPDRRRHQRVGQRCPLFPDLAAVSRRAKATMKVHASRVAEAEAGPAEDAEARAAMLEGLASWVCSSVVPQWVYQHFQLEKPGEESTPELARENGRLFLFMHDLRERWRRLGQLLGRGLAAGDGEPPWLGGLYLAGTGSDAANEQGFVAGVFRRLDEEEAKGTVSWTEQALREDTACQGWVGRVWLLLAVLVLAIVGLAVYLVLTLGKR